MSACFLPGRGHRAGETAELTEASKPDAVLAFTRWVCIHSLTHSRTHSFTQQTPTAPVRASSTLGAGAVDGNKAWCSCRSARFPLVETDDQQRGNTQLHEVGALRGNRRVRGRRQGWVLAGTPPRGDAGGGLQSRATPAEAGA